jgi:hypothetical protein
MFYLHRGASPEGPYEEARIVHMIRTGELTQGAVCPVGQQQWWPIETVPSFARVLAERAAYQYGAPPAFTPGGAAMAPAAPHGAPPPGVAPQKSSEPRGAGRAILIAGLVGVLLLFIAGSAIGAYLLFFSGSGAPKVIASVPRESELLIELPSVSKLLLDMKQVQHLESSLRDDKKLAEQTADSIAKAFDITPVQALALVAATENGGLMARKLSSTPEAAFVVGFRNAGPVEDLLKSPRFVVAGALGQTGKRYTLAKKQLTSSAGQDGLFKALADAELGSGKEVLVWFPKHKLLSLGSDAYVAEVAKVIEDGAATIETNPSYQAAQKDFAFDARVSGFVDPNVFASVAEPKLKELIDGYFKPAGPITAGMRVGAAGFASTLTARVMGTKLPRAAAYAPPRTLGLPARLPQETVVYVAMSSQTKLSGAELQKLSLEQLAVVQPRARQDFEQGIAELERALGVSLAKLFDALGEEAVLGLAMAPDFSVDASALRPGPELGAKLGVTWVQALKDESEYKRLAAELKQKVFPRARGVSVTEDGPGFALAPRGVTAPVSLRVKFFDRFLFVSAGGNALCDRAEAAFTKADRSLKDDAAHQAAIAGLPETQHARVWLDSGRISETLLKNPLLRARASETGMQLDRIKVSGPERVTSAFSVRAEVQNEIWTLRIDTLNPQSLAPLGLGAAALGGLPRGLGGGTLPPL